MEEQKKDVRLRRTIRKALKRRRSITPHEEISLLWSFAIKLNVGIFSVVEAWSFVRPQGVHPL